MTSLFEELEAREAAARLRVEELEAEVAELSGKLELARAGLERLRITRQTVAEVLVEMTPEKQAVAVDAGQSVEGGPVVSAYAGAERQIIGVLTVPNWQPGMCARPVPSGAACLSPWPSHPAPCPDKPARSQHVLNSWVRRRANAWWSPAREGPARPPAPCCSSKHF
ncbi:hypothetical protein [Streptomyces sp. NPDC003857]